SPLRPTAGRAGRNARPARRGCAPTCRGCRRPNRRCSGGRTGCGHHRGWRRDGRWTCGYLQGEWTGTELPATAGIMDIECSFEPVTGQPQTMSNPNPEMNALGVMALELAGGEQPRAAALSSVQAGELATLVGRDLAKL